MQYTYFVTRNTTKLTTRGGTSPDGVEMALIRERKSTHRLGRGYSPKRFDALMGYDNPDEGLTGYPQRTAVPNNKIQVPPTTHITQLLLVKLRLQEN